MGAISSGSTVTKSGLSLGSPSERGYPILSEEISSKVRDVFWDIFMVSHGRDCFDEFARELGCSRFEAKVIYYGIMHKRGFVQDSLVKESKIKMTLAKEVKRLLGDDLTVYQIMDRAEDSVTRRRTGTK